MKIDEYQILKGLNIKRNDYQLKSIRMEHAEAIRTWRNDQIDCLRQKKPLSAEDQEAYFNQVVLPSFRSKEPALILVGLFKKGSLIGYGGIVHLNWICKRGEVSFLLCSKRSSDPELYCREFKIFLSMIRELAFMRLGLNKLSTEAYTHRPHHVDAIEESGFAREGVLRQQTRVKGQWHDAVVASCLKAEYLKRPK